MIAGEVDPLPLGVTVGEGVAVLVADVVGVGGPVVGGPPVGVVVTLGETVTLTVGDGLGVGWCRGWVRLGVGVGVGV